MKQLILLGLMAIFVPAPLIAEQEPTPPKTILDVQQEAAASDTGVFHAFSRAARNPLSYGPAVLLGVTGSLEWRSSQRYFRQGWLEANPRFTTSGRRNAEPLTEAAGYRRIVVREVLPMLGTSMAINTFSYWAEKNGSPRLGRIIRWTAWGALTAVSQRSFRQWRRNQAGTP